VSAGQLLAAAQINAGETLVRIDLPDWLLWAFLFILGTIVGSFLNVAVYRIPQYDRFWDSLKGLIHPPSCCPRCRTPIQLRDNIPVLGWLLLRGRCRSCKMWISPQYPIIEFLNGLLFLLVYWMEVPQGAFATLSESCLFTSLGPEVAPGLGSLSGGEFVLWRYAYHMILIEALLVATLIDLRLMVIPDGVTLPAMAIGLIGAVVFGCLHLWPVWYQQPGLAEHTKHLGFEWLSHLVYNGPRIPAWVSTSPHLHGFAMSLAGIVIGGGVVWVVRVAGSWALQREAMGDGDVVLMAMVGAFIGWQATIIAFIVAAFIAVVVVLGGRLVIGMPLRMLGLSRHWNDEFPYGPFLALGTLTTILFWKGTSDATDQLFGAGPLLIIFGGLVAIMSMVSIFLVQLGKRLFGYPIGPPEEEVVWTSADQTHFFAGEKSDRHTNNWRLDDWPGIAASTGALNHDRWRHGR